MSHSARLAREDAITEALHVSDKAIGDETPTPQALRIIEALKRMRDGKPVRISSTTAVDYMDQVQSAARAAWQARHGDKCSPTDSDDATAGIDTPIGRLRMVTWRRIWAGSDRARVVWAGEYYLNDEPITVADMKAAGLARRPTTRNRQKNKRRT